MTDNELTAAIGRELFGWKIDETPSATWKFWLVGHSGEHTRQAWAEKPSDEIVGELLVVEGFAYSTDPRWIGPIIIAAAKMGIEACVHSLGDKWKVWAFNDEPDRESFMDCDSDSDLPRTLCRAILRAKGIEVG